MNKKLLNVLALVFSFSTLLTILIFIILDVGNLAVTGDFINPFTGALMVADGRGSELYSLDTQRLYQKNILKGVIGEYSEGMVLPFRSLPFVTLVFIPFTYFSFVTAYKFYFIFNLLLLFVFVYLIKKTFPSARKRSYLLSLPFIFLPAISTLYMGQTSFLPAIAFLLVYKSLKEKRDFAAGIFTSLLLIKVQYFIAAPFVFLLASKRVEFLKGLFYSSVVVVGISILITGPDFLMDYPRFLAVTENPNFGSRAFHMFTLFGFMAGFFSDKTAFWINLFTYLTALFVFFLLLRRKSFDKLFASATLLSLVFSVHLLSFDLVILLVPIYIIINLLYRKVKAASRLDILVVLSLFIVPALASIAGNQPVLSWVILSAGLYLLFGK